jgi:hypothetical protein
MSLLWPSWATADIRQTEYKNADGSKVVVSPVGKLSGHQDNESKLEFYSTGNQRLCTLDYSSEDGEHGFGVVKAAWTPDSQYFVFSLTSSGGHQSWHAPTLFYSVKIRAIFSLDGYVEGSGIAKGDFTLKAPNIVVTEVWKDKSVPVSFHLDVLAADSRGSNRPLACVEGKVIRREFARL